MIDNTSKQKPYLLKNRFAGLFAILVLCIMFNQCAQKPQVNMTVLKLNGFEKAKLDSNRIYSYYDILETFPAKRSCSKSKIYYNLYVCKNVTIGDTIWIFEECTPVSPHALDTVSNFMAFLGNESVKTTPPEEAIIFIPSNFKVQLHRKYIFGKLEYLTEY